MATRRLEEDLRLAVHAPNHMGASVQILDNRFRGSRLEGRKTIQPQAGPHRISAYSLPFQNRNELFHRGRQHFVLL